VQVAVDETANSARSKGKKKQSAATYTAVKKRLRSRQSRTNITPNPLCRLQAVAASPSTICRIEKGERTDQLWIEW